MFGLAKVSLMDQGLFNLGKRQLQGHLTARQCLWMVLEGMEPDPSERNMVGEGHKLKERKFHLSVRKEIAL